MIDIEKKEHEVWIKKYIEDNRHILIEMLQEIEGADHPTEKQIKEEALRWVKYSTAPLSGW